MIPAKQPVLQTTVQRNKPARPSLNDYERESQNLALSFKSNPYVAAAMPSSLASPNTQPQFASVLNDQYTRLASSYNQPNPRKPEHDLLQTFYPNTLQARSQEPDTVSVGQPLYIQKARMPPATRAKMQNKVSNLLKNAMNNFNKAPMRNPASTNTFNGATPQLYNKPVANLNVKSNPNENIDDAHADMRDPNESIDNKPPQEPGIDDRPAVAQSANSPSVMTLVQKPGEELRPAKPVSNTLNGLGKPVVTGKPTFVSQPPQNTLAQNLAAPAADKVKLGQPSINLDLIKNKILHSTNAAFLRRMLKLIQKITHHKDFHKLQAPARSFVAQANTAVQALNKAYNERVSSSPVTLGTGNKFYPQSKKSAVQTMNQAYNAKIQASPVNLGTGNQLYGNNYPLRKKSTVQALNQAYNKRISASPVNPATGNSQYYRNAYSLSKKFQIARNPYYQNYYQYRQPYYNNLQSIQYGLYNGNVP